MHSDSIQTSEERPEHRSRRRLLLLIPSMMASAALLTACAGQATPTPKSAAEQAPAKPADAKPAAPPAASPAAAAAGKPVGKSYPAAPAMSIDPNKKYTAVIKTSMGDMTAELYAKDAPNTVNNFVYLSQKGYYDGLNFHRVIANFMVQGGDPVGNGTGGPGYKFGDEFSPAWRHSGPGMLSMANAGPNTQGSQFFICHGPGAERLPKNYSIFGKVTGGIEVLDKIAAVPVRPGPGGENSQPLDPPKIDTVEISEG